MAEQGEVKSDTLFIIKEEIVKLRLRNAANEGNIKVLMRYYNKLIEDVNEMKTKNGISVYPKSTSFLPSPTPSGTNLNCELYAHIRQHNKKKRKCCCRCF